VSGQTYGAIARYLAELGEQPAGAPFAAYYNMDMQDLDVEIGFPVTRPLRGKGEIHPGEIPGGLMASVMHIGPYPDCGLAYEALTQFVKDQGHTATGVAYEMYLNDPSVTPPQELMTQVVFPLQPVPRKANA
jgi:effector-binding domain-containing protein